MRTALCRALKSGGSESSIWAELHPQLAYTAWAPVARSDGKVADQQRQQWLEAICNWQPHPDYDAWYEHQWRSGLLAQAERCECFELELASRLLIGSGNVSATDVGLTLHRVWGVPVIPGSALKGLASSYAALAYGGEHQAEDAAESDDLRALRARWRSPAAEGGAGDIYRQLFGLPPARGEGAGAVRGSVRFLDALYVPGSANNRPLALDVTTVHHKAYYDSSGARWPNDWESPTPISYLAVAPGTQFRFALAGPEEPRRAAKQLLEEALERWGIAAKTSAGYGRLVAPGARKAQGPPPQPGARLKAVLLEEKTKKGGWRARDLNTGWEGSLEDTHNAPANAAAGLELELTVTAVNARRHAISFAFCQSRPQSTTNKKSKAAKKGRKRR
jgi:CRISPR-associated protein Cmr6